MNEQRQGSNRNNFLITTIIVILIAAITGLSVYFILKTKNDDKVNKIQKQLDDLESERAAEEKQSSSEKPTSSNQVTTTTKAEVVPSYATDWYKFISPNYGFSFRYPKTGVDPKQVSQPGIDAIRTSKSEKACSYPLTVEDNSHILKKNDEYTAVWNYAEFFGLFVRPADQSIASYIKSQDPEGYRSYQNIDIPGAKEAVKIDSKTTREYYGYPPLAYTNYIINDGKNLYLLGGFQNVGFSGDCVPADFGATLDQIVSTFNFYN